MSCQIKSVANLTDTHGIKKTLLGDAIGKFDHIPNNELPVQDCLVSLSSAGDVLVLAWNRRVVILASKWDSQEQGEVKNKFHVVWSGDVGKEQNELITFVVCLSLVSLGKASIGSGPDWTCIAIGFNTGFIRFYTETGATLLSEQLHNEPVIGIKCQSFSLPKHSGEVTLSEELHIIYNSVVCILQGFPLFSTLRACRNHLARVQAKCDDFPPPTNLAYKKWSFKSQDIVNDAEVIGTTSVNIFDHLVTASICSGHKAHYRSSAPQHNLVIAIGKRPFIGFHYALEGSTAPVLSDVAIAMASKLANAIGAAMPWFRGGPKVEVSPDATATGNNEPAESMMCRFGLSDIMREGDCIISSPNKALSVVSDAMGRVILIDNRRGIAVRMWKGYRDAQCGWIEVEEEQQSGSRSNHSKRSQNARRRTALFLIIYAPKKGVIDIWGIQHGSKITTFTASKNGRLLYINYGLLGLNDVALLPRNNPQYGCVFMDPLGGLKEISVPFHFALSSKNGKRARDLHLLKKLKTFLREKDFNNQLLITEITNTCSEIKTSEVKIQTVEMLMSNNSIIPDALLAATDCFVQKLDESEKDTVQQPVKTLHDFSNNLRQVIVFYKYINSEFNVISECSSAIAEQLPTAHALASLLITSEREIHRILKLSKALIDLDRSRTKNVPKVKFEEDGYIFVDFLSCFDFGSSPQIGLKKDVNIEKKYQLSELIFGAWMNSDDTIETWKKAAADSNIQPFVLMQFALTYWLYRMRNVPLEVELKRFTQLVQAICLLTDVKEICAEYNEISEWWSNVRNILADSVNPFNALTAAITCRAVGMTLERYKEADKNNRIQDDNENQETKLDDNEMQKTNTTPDDETYSSMSEWENVSKESCQFTLMIGFLEDVTVLNAIVSQKAPSGQTTKFFKLPFEKMDISLGILLSKGKGSVSEIVAKWLSFAGVDPAQLVDSTDIEFDKMQLSVDSLKITGSWEEVPIPESSQQDKNNLLSMPVELGNEPKGDTTAQAYILEKLSLLKRHFPYSLTSSVLLANLCWEFVMSWSKNVSQLEALEAALGVLQQIPMLRMKHGVCCLLWSLHLKKRLEAAAKLMNKLGKLPKERLCKQDIGLSDIQLSEFLQHCVTFLEIFYISTAYGEGKYETIKSEELWEGYTSGPESFAKLAVSQASAWYEFVYLHMQVANVLHMIAHFNLKVLKPLNNLFESEVQSYFFQDITETVSLPFYHDIKRDKLRMQFLCEVITASMDSIHQETTNGKSLSSTQAVLWMSKCQKMAMNWMLNDDHLRIHQVCQLYINGFDRLAEEVVTAVRDTRRLAVKLLPIAGRRMMAYLSKTPDLLEEVSRISTPLTKYLESLDVCEVVLTNCSNDDTVELIRRISRDLPESYCNYHLAQLMLDATFIFEGKP